MQKNQLKGIVYLLITAIIWGGAFISQFFGGRTLGSFTFNGYRSIFGCLSIAIMIYFDSFDFDFSELNLFEFALFGLIVGFIYLYLLLF